MEKNVLDGVLLKGTLLDPDVVRKTIGSRKVKAKLIRREGGWLPKENEASAMMADSKRIFCVPGNATTGQLENPLEGLKKG